MSKLNRQHLRDYLLLTSSQLNAKLVQSVQLHNMSHYKPGETMEGSKKRDKAHCELLGIL